MGGAATMILAWFCRLIHFPPLVYSNDQTGITDRHASDFVWSGQGHRGAEPHAPGGLCWLLGAGAWLVFESVLGVFSEACFAWGAVPGVLWLSSPAVIKSSDQVLPSCWSHAWFVCAWRGGDIFWFIPFMSFVMFCVFCFLGGVGREAGEWGRGGVNSPLISIQPLKRAKTDCYCSP